MLEALASSKFVLSKWYKRSKYKLQTMDFLLKGMVYVLSKTVSSFFFFFSVAFKFIIGRFCLLA